MQEVLSSSTPVAEGKEAAGIGRRSWFEEDFHSHLSCPVQSSEAGVAFRVVLSTSEGPVIVPRGEVCDLG